jgi:hypothetical protein
MCFLYRSTSLNAYAEMRCSQNSNYSSLFRIPTVDFYYWLFGAQFH